MTDLSSVAEDSPITEQLHTFRGRPGSILESGILETYEARVGYWEQQFNCALGLAAVYHLGPQWRPDGPQMYDIECGLNYMQGHIIPGTAVASEVAGEAGVPRYLVVGTYALHDTIEDHKHIDRGVLIADGVDPYLAHNADELHYKDVDYHNNSLRVSRSPVLAAAKGSDNLINVANTSLFHRHEQPAKVLKRLRQYPLSAAHLGSVVFGEQLRVDPDVLCTQAQDMPEAAFTQLVDAMHLMRTNVMRMVQSSPLAGEVRAAPLSGNEIRDVFLLLAPTIHGLLSGLCVVKEPLAVVGDLAEELHTADVIV